MASSITIINIDSFAQKARKVIDAIDGFIRAKKKRCRPHTDPHGDAQPGHG
jgi:hypothetical protein